jgi:hypothetical protein
MSCFCRASKLSPIQTVQARCSRPPELWSHVLLLPLTLQGCVPLTCPPAHLPSLSQPSQLKGSASAEVAAKEWRTQVVTPAGGKAQARQSTSHVQQQVGGGGGTHVPQPPPPPTPPPAPPPGGGGGPNHVAAAAGNTQLNCAHV